jgi:2C-methyl-D-erythritol 2,4-cyclodiphosphate synthase
VTTTPDDQQELEKEIEQTREQLGQTVEALAAKVDVKARAREKLGQAGQQIKERPVPVAISAGVVGALVLFFTLIRRWMRNDK